MPIDPGPHSMDKIAYLLGRDGSGTNKALSPNFYQELDTEIDADSGFVLIQHFTFSEPWPTWEVHPRGDEFVYLLKGDTDFILWRDESEELVRVNEPGSYVCVPQGLWHTARPHEETTLLFVTPGEGTLNAESPHDLN